MILVNGITIIISMCRCACGFLITRYSHAYFFVPKEYTRANKIFMSRKLMIHSK